ncbi:MAG: fibronectin type III domain-containing protein [Nitrospirae bacterium]|nr:fibronectin type III domain-containing protein [Nitrospirota bacterium]
MLNGSGITVNVNGASSDTYPFSCDNTGNIRFISPMGSDSSDGKTKATAWKTLETVVNRMKPGDFLYLTGGTHQTGRVGIGSQYAVDDWYPGTDAERITMTSFPGEEAIVKDEIDAKSSYWSFARITFEGPGNNFYGPLEMGDRTGYSSSINPHGVSSGINSIGNEFRGTMWLAMEAYGNNFVIQGNYVKFTPDTTAPSGHAYSLYMCSGLNRTIKDNEIYGGATWLMHYYDESRVAGEAGKAVSGIIEGNIFDATNNGGIGLRGAIIFEVINNASTGIPIDFQSMIVRNNIFYTRDNGLIDPGFAMVYMRANVKNVKIYNNVFYNMNQNAIRGDSSTASNIEVKNNIFSNISGTGNYDINIHSWPSNPVNVVADQNLFAASPKLYDIIDSHQIVGDPKFSSLSTYDFHLQSTSPAIDSGLSLAEVATDFDGNLRPMDGDNDGTAKYDIGAYEYTGTYTPPAPDTQAPTVPTSLTATPISSTQINISWNSSTDNVGVTGYKIYKNGSQIATTTSTSYSSTGLGPSTAYNFTVEAYDAAGNSALSAPVSATTQAGADTQAPTVPSGLTATALSPTQINLSWSVSTDNVGVAGYKIFRNGLQVATSNSLTYSDTGLIASTSYTYKIRAYDASGNISADSTSASANTPASPDTQAPFIPSGVTAVATSSSQISLSWNATTDNVGVTGYSIYRNGSLIATSTSTVYADTGLSPSTFYTYSIKAYDAVGNVSAGSSSASATTQNVIVDHTPPSPPRNLRFVQ